MILEKKKSESIRYRNILQYYYEDFVAKSTEPRKSLVIFAVESLCVLGLLSYGCVLCAHARRAYALEEPAPPVGPRREALVVGIFSARSNVGLR